ncbi:DUF4139 domain-containing protein [Croceicoccus naphthovorans]|uniref:DUF4139 domain-containing protein n=1 Tax=Croceicoccus naphthovorans TaxID=1348774 RepID=UPI00069DB95B|nr:hypothetical protein [Croceicoccus naphthovorans]MBB3988874.1 hypothetical protein [Croceicoccus naphthovorans]
MRPFPLIAAILLTGVAITPAQARTVVEASAPQDLSVTVYRDPNRNEGAMNVRWLNGFALISETRTVTLPPGESTIRFDGVAESMVAVSAIVTGLPGGTIEKNRNAEILSPASLVDGTLGNRVTITRTNPATGTEVSESAVVRTRADGGLVLQTREGYEAVRCAGIPERLTFDRVPTGLSPNPVYTVDTRSDAGGTHTVTLTYLAWGFDWSAHYIATLAEPEGRKRRLDLKAWLTVANSNGQTFENAELLAVAGKLEVQTNYRSEAQPPRGEPLRITCYPLGSTSAGIDIPPPPPPPAPPPMAMADAIVVTGMRKMEMAAAPVSMVADEMLEASEEGLGDLKLYRVPVSVDVAAQSQKQVAFLSLGNVEGHVVHRVSCQPGEFGERLADAVLRTDNTEDLGLGRALPAGGVTVFAPTAFGPLLLSEDTIEDRAVGQEVEVVLSAQTRVSAACSLKGEKIEDANLSDGKWHTLEADIANDTDETIEIEVGLGPAARWQVRKSSTKVAFQNGTQVLRQRIAAGGSKTLRWQVRYAPKAPAE